MKTEQEVAFLESLETLAGSSRQTRVQQFSNFAAWAPRQNIARFLAAYEIYKHVIDVHGIVVECGVALGAGLFTWSHLASVLEPFNYSRRVVGFDLAPDEDAWADLKALAEAHDMNRPIGHISRIDFMRGDAVQMIPAFVASQPGLIVALLILDFTVAEPTRVALEHLVPLMPRGGVVVSGGIWPGELKQLDPQMPWRRCPWSSTLIWAVKP